MHYSDTEYRRQYCRERIDQIDEGNRNPDRWLRYSYPTAAGTDAVESHTGTFSRHFASAIYTTYAVGVWGRQAAPEDLLLSPVWGDKVAPHGRKRKILGGLAALQTSR